MNWGYYLKGISIIAVTGDNLNRLINLCSLNNIHYKLQKTKSSYQFFIPYKEKEDLLTYIHKLGLSYEIIEEKGFPILYFKYKVRYWVLLLCVLFVCVLYKFSLYIWNIEVVGTSNYTSEQILNYVRTNSVPFGSKKKSINCNKLEEALRLQFNNLGWINCSIEGTKLTIEVLETIPPNNYKINTEACNIVAIKDATVYDAIATSGYLVTEKGMEVKKGDVLITGVIPVYSDYGDVQGTKYIAANGTVYGMVTYEYKDIIPLLETVNIPQKGKSIYSIEIGGFSLNVPAYNKNTITEHHQIKIGKTYYLPISICKKTKVTYEDKTIELTEENAIQIANENLQKYMQDLRKKRVEIVQNNVKIHIVNGQCVSNGQIICKEQIGIAIPIDCENQGEE